MLKEERDAIEKLREKAMARIREINKEHTLIHPKDVDLIANTNDMLWRFLLLELDCNDKVKEEEALHLVNFENACKLLIDTLKWRKQYGLHDLTDRHFPREFYQIGMFFHIHHTDINRFLLFVRANKYLRISAATREFMIKCMLFETEKRVGELSPRYDRGFYDLNAITILDCTNIGFQSLDTQMLIAVLSLSCHFPLLGRELWVYGLPRFAQWVTPLVRKALPKYIDKRTFFVTHEEAVKRLGLHKLPKFMGGTCPIDPILEVPDGTVSLDELAKEPNFPWKPSETARFKKHFEQVMGCKN